MYRAAGIDQDSEVKEVSQVSSITVGKVLNNNVIIAEHPQYAEVVVIGKGIGFNRKTRDRINLSSVEKMFILRSQEEQEQYKQLVPQVDEKLIEVVRRLCCILCRAAARR